MARRRVEPNRAADPDDPWARLVAQGTGRDGYKEACALDMEGRYNEADEALRASGVREEVIENRRAHINWRLSQGMPAIGSM